MVQVLVKAPALTLAGMATDMGTTTWCWSSPVFTAALYSGTAVGEITNGAVAATFAGRSAHPMATTVHG
ncbi:MAG: hypothetical protein QOI70_169, partial [Microbacteriaceae bacterium]|nr:hypothetical protein [Microbacteriaceae bacterium]